MLTFLKGYRTAIVGALFAALGFLETYDWVDIVPAGMEMLVVAVIGAVMIGLRAITNTAMGSST